MKTNRLDEARFEHPANRSAKAWGDVEVLRAGLRVMTASRLELQAESDEARDAYHAALAEVGGAEAKAVARAEVLRAVYQTAVDVRIRAVEMEATKAEALRAAVGAAVAVDISVTSHE